MFQLLNQYVDQGWATFPANDAIIGDNLTCPFCGACYIDPGTGKLKLEELYPEESTDDHIRANSTAKAPVGNLTKRLTEKDIARTSDTGEYECPVCKKAFGTVRGTVNHAVKMHKEVYDIESIPSVDASRVTTRR